jgi:hypothetical protein
VLLGLLVPLCAHIVDGRGHPPPLASAHAPFLLQIAAAGCTARLIVSVVANIAEPRIAIVIKAIFLRIVWLSLNLIIRTFILVLLLESSSSLRVLKPCMALNII